MDNSKRQFPIIFPLLQTFFDNFVVYDSVPIVWFVSTDGRIYEKVKLNWENYVKRCYPTNRYIFTLKIQESN